MEAKQHLTNRDVQQEKKHRKPTRVIHIESSDTETSIKEEEGTDNQEEDTIRRLKETSQEQKPFKMFWRG